MICGVRIQRGRLEYLRAADQRWTREVSPLAVMAFEIHRTRLQERENVRLREPPSAAATAATAATECGIRRLPDRLLGHVLSFLASCTVLTSAAHTCRHWRDAVATCPAALSTMCSCTLRHAEEEKRRTQLVNTATVFCTHAAEECTFVRHIRPNAAGRLVELNIPCLSNCTIFERINEDVDLAAFIRGGGAPHLRKAHVHLLAALPVAQGRAASLESLHLSSGSYDFFSTEECVLGTAALERILQEVPRMSRLRALRITDHIPVGSKLLGAALRRSSRLQSLDTYLCAPAA